MKNFLSNNRIGALMTILILAVGSISIVGTSQFVMGQDDNNLVKNLLGGCIYGACKDTKITGNTTNGILAGCVFAGCKNVEITGQPTPNTATLIVTKKVVCGGASNCPPASSYKIKVSGDNPSPDSFDGSTTGTTVTLGSGKYTISETIPVIDFTPSYSGNCKDNLDGTASGNINAGETQECTITNTFQD